MAPELRTVLSPLLSCEERAIWITVNSYARLNDDDDDDDDDDDFPVDDRHEKQFCLSVKDKEDAHFLSIHASTLEEAIICLEYLVGLKDTHFREIGLCEDDNSVVDPRPFLFDANTLEKTLQNSARRIKFNFMIFTPDHCRSLATSGTKTDIEFHYCEFQEEGAAFVEASATRQDETSGPAKLCIVGINPFNDRNWALFLIQHKLESLELEEVNLSSELGCRAVATAEVQCLTLGDDCELDDGGAALVESVREGRGPRGLCFSGDRFGSSESFFAFMNALRGNEHLERLFITSIDNHQETQALAAAMHENKGLVHLEVNFRSWDQSYSTEFLKAISLHPSLRSLNLTTMWQSDFYLKKRRDATKAVADMLSVNDRVELMMFDDYTFNKYDWDAYVAPRLECSTYRKRFLLIQKIGEASTRAAVLARTLATFSSKPHLVWMILNQNRDIVSTYLDSSHDQNSIPSRKRSLSPSLDGMSASD
jgi:hypothetical protein